MHSFFVHILIHTFAGCGKLVIAELKLPAWSDLEKRIHRQTFSLSQPFTFPAGDVSVDLEKIDELVKKTSSSSNTQTKT